MREYSIHINFTVDARDYDEAIEIAKAARKAVEDCEYKVRDVETPHGGIEEL